ncbi:MAG: UvrD-helicase domain-containing protein, partial [Gemmatimonadaceae bacterium]
MSWEDAGLRPLSDEQWTAVRAAHAGHVLVSAGAGSGKTHTVVAAVAWHLGVPIRGETCSAVLQLRDIAAITFTNRAAADLKAKLRATLNSVGLKAQANDLDLARIGTIHAFCGEILREFALRVGAPPIRDVLEENQGNTLRTDAVRDVLLAAAEAEDVIGLHELFAEYKVEDVERWVGALAAESDRVAALAARISELEPRERALVELARRAVAQSVERLDEMRAVDFDRMIVRSRDLVRDHADVRRRLQRDIKLLIVDEFQDVDPVQQEIARLLGDSADGGTRLMLVGDAKQSIYRFRRADVTVWRDVERQFGPGKTAPLSTNYRSTDAILAFVEASAGKILNTPI